MASRPTISWTHGIVLDHLGTEATAGCDQLWHIADGSTTTPCIVPSGELARALDGKPLVAHSLQLVAWEGGDGTASAMLPVLTSALVEPDHEAPLRFLPDSLCPVAGVVRATVALIDQIKADPLRLVVQRIFLRRDVARSFWRMPAAWQHHHAYQGGLATHSLEVAKDLAGQAALAGHERDLAIAAGLLHDIGKAWAYTDDMRLTDEARAVGHERIGLDRLHEELYLLQLDWPDGAHAMRVLLDGSPRKRSDGSMPSALVARLRAADQRSCELERRSRNDPAAWVPRPWVGKPGLRLVQSSQDLGYEPF